MARTWLSVTVDLLGGRGGELWPWPGRVFAVGPSHTFRDLAEAINGAFARWDLAHLSVFTLADGRVVTDEESAEEMALEDDGPTTMDFATAKVARTLGHGADFRFTFDLGDRWVHRCVVDEEKVDPLELLGIIPEGPMAYSGWGSIPDQYGRRWADDDGSDQAPKRPKQRHPMLDVMWPEQMQARELDIADVRVAIATKDAVGFLAAVAGCDIDDALQHVGGGIPMALDLRRQETEPVARSVINRLITRGAVGDQVLAEDLEAHLRNEPLAGRVLPVDLDMLSSVLEQDPNMSSGGFIDLRTGEVYHDHDMDPMMVGDDLAIDMEEEPERWLGSSCLGSRDGWQDMAEFAQRQHDGALRERLERAIEGRGAFRRFRDLVHAEDIADQWHLFSNDRQLGRARDYLADADIRVG